MLVSSADKPEYTAVPRVRPLGPRSAPRPSVVLSDAQRARTPRRPPRRSQRLRGRCLPGLPPFTARAVKARLGAEEESSAPGTPAERARPPRAPPPPARCEGAASGSRRGVECAFSGASPARTFSWPCVVKALRAAGELFRAPPSFLAPPRSQPPAPLQGDVNRGGGRLWKSRSQAGPKSRLL